jgi:membrane protein DedA with SNARE-associated domain
VLIAALHLHLHLRLLHHLQGPTIDYVGVASAACVSWILGAGPGEPVLIAAGVFAAKHKLDIKPVVFWAWVGATVGGVIGWLVGMKAGRSVLTAPGPLRQLRVSAVKRGEAMFKRMEVVAIVLTPSWVAGINRSRARLYLPVDALQALLLWAIPLGVGAYYVGPPVLDLFDDAGTVASLIVVAVVLAAVVSALLRRRAIRRGRRAEGHRA